jgi:glycosyltransferase involved in cell wall biosynthesis
MGEILHSVVIICYNQEDSIERTILSVVNQTVSPCELIILDDCSTDSTFKIAQEFFSVSKGHTYSVRLIKNDRNLGIPGNAKKAGEVVSGNVITTVAGDDVLVPDGIKTINESIIKNRLNPDKDYFISISNTLLSNNGLVNRVDYHRYGGENLLRAAIRKTMSFVKVGFSINAYRYGEYPSNIGHWADWFWDVSICSHKHVLSYKIDIPVYIYSVGVGVGSRASSEALNESYMKAANLIRIEFNHQISWVDNIFLLGESLYIKSRLTKNSFLFALALCVNIFNVLTVFDAVIAKSIVARYVPLKFIKKIRG